MYDFGFHTFHLLRSWSALHCNSNAICGFKIGSSFSMLELPKVVELSNENWLENL